VEVTGVAPEGEKSVEVQSLSITPGDDTEYERAVQVDATLTGPRGEVRIDRRYEALPRHNDVVDPGAVDSNDELLAQADAVHVYTKWFVDDAYVGDDHDIWEHADPSVLTDDAAFTSASREHVERTAAQAYASGFER
jgi:hypothetical protein